MIHHLPRWVWAGGCLLGFVAGLVNAVGYLGLSHQAISHITGTTTLTALSLGIGDLSRAVHLSGILFSFFLGALVSGLFIPQPSLQLRRRYSALLALEAGLFFAAGPLLAANLLLGEYVASFACGLQNAMATSFSGAVVRTTHVSGLVTDLGLLFGRALRGGPWEGARLKLYCGLLGGFFAGGLVGVWLFQELRYDTFFVAGGLVACFAVVQEAVRRRWIGV